MHPFIHASIHLFILPIPSSYPPYCPSYEHFPNLLQCLRIIWFQIEVGNEIVIHFLLSLISSLDFMPLFVPIEANSGSVCSQWRRQRDNWGGANIHIFVFIDHKNNRFQKKLIMQNTTIWIFAPPIITLAAPLSVHRSQFIVSDLTRSGIKSRSLKQNGGNKIGWSYFFYRFRTCVFVCEHHLKHHFGLSLRTINEQTLS